MVISTSNVIPFRVRKLTLNHVIAEMSHFVCPGASCSTDAVWRECSLVLIAIHFGEHIVEGCSANWPENGAIFWNFLLGAMRVASQYLQRFKGLF